MRNKSIILFLILVFINFQFVFAKDTYIDFRFPSKILQTSREYKVEFLYKLENSRDEDFILVPDFSGGAVEIYDENKKVWIRQDSLRTSFPKLSHEKVIRVIGFEGIKADICFEVQHLKSTQIFRSPCRTYWNRAYLSKYLSAINDRILKWENRNAF